MWRSKRTCKCFEGTEAQQATAAITKVQVLKKEVDERDAHSEEQCAKVGQ